MDGDKRQFADQLLDASLERSSGVEPQRGLEGRILAGVVARQQSVRRRTLLMGFTFSALAVAVAFFTVSAPRQTAVRVAPPAPVAIPKPEVASAPTRELPQTAKVSTPGGVPQRPPQFPTPAPLSEQEKLLLLYVKEAPKSELASPLPTIETDLEIPEISTAALEIKDLPGTDDEK